MHLEDIVFIPLNQEGKFAIIDSADAERVLAYRWRLSHGRCAVRSARAHEGRRGSTVFMHRVILDAPDGFEGDHINGNPLDNRRGNLRICTHAENQRNMARHHDNRSGFKGVDWHKASKKWRAVIHDNGRQRLAGYFDTAEEAAHAYDAVCREVHGAFARLNFP